MNLGSLVKRTFATVALITGIGLATAFAQDRSTNDFLITGDETILIRSEDNNPLPADIEYDLLASSGDSTSNVVEYTADEDGKVEIEDMLVHWELYVNIPKVNYKRNESIVFPTPAGASVTVNIKTDKEPGQMEIYSIKGDLTDIVNGPVEYENGIAGYFVNCLLDNPKGIYIFKVETSEGIATGKILKGENFQTNYGGIIDIPEKETEDENHKSLEEYYAVYQKTITYPGYDTLIVIDTLYEGDNGTKLYFLEEEGSNIPQYQWITGYTYELNGPKLSGVIVEMYNRANDAFIERDTSSSSAYVEFEYPVPAGTDVYFKAYKNEDYRCWDASNSTNAGDTYEVPNVIVFESDTTNPNLRINLWPKQLNIPNGGTANPQSQQIREMLPTDLNVEVGLRNMVYWLDPTLPQPRINAYRTNATNFGNLIGHSDLMEESDTELNLNLNGYDPYTNPKPVGINVRPGSNNTSTNTVNVTTPLGNNLLPVFSSETTISGIDVYAHYHEMYLAFGGVITSGWGGISDSEGNAPTNNDQSILNSAATHTVNIYDNQKSSFTLRCVYDEIQTSSAFPAKEVPSPSVKKEKTTNSTSNEYGFSGLENYNYINQ